LYIMHMLPFLTSQEQIGLVTVQAPKLDPLQLHSEEIGFTGCWTIDCVIVSCSPCGRPRGKRAVLQDAPSCWAVDDYCIACTCSRCSRRKCRSAWLQCRLPNLTLYSCSEEIGFTSCWTIDCAVIVSCSCSRPTPLSFQRTVLRKQPRYQESRWRRALCAAGHAAGELFCRMHQAVGELSDD